jgi:hypothetical protein
VLERLDLLLHSKKFWCGVLAFNVILVWGQPIPLLWSAAALLALYFLRTFLALVRKVGVRRLLILLLLAFGFLASWVFALSEIQQRELFSQDDSRAGAALAFSAVLWGLPFVVWRWWQWLRRHAARRAARLASELSTREAEERGKQDTEDQRRREAARASCELLYKLHAPEIQGRFPRAAFDEFVRTYMTDQHDPGLVEDRAEQLKGIIEQHRQRIEPPRKKLTLGQLAEWFVREKQQIESLPLDDEDKASLLAQLEAKFAKLQEKHIRSMEP